MPSEGQCERFAGVAARVFGCLSTAGRSAEAQFWEYHYDPFQYWLVAILSLLVVPVIGDFRYFAIPGLLLLSSIGYSFSRHHGMHPGPAEHGIVADMTEAINKRVPAGVPVQPIDWTTGAVQALLRTEHPIGTRFLYDYHFYHHVQTPVIQELRTEFVSQLVTCRVPFYSRGRS